MFGDGLSMLCGVFVSVTPCCFDADIVVGLCLEPLSIVFGVVVFREMLCRNVSSVGI